MSAAACGCFSASAFALAEIGGQLFELAECGAGSIRHLTVSSLEDFEFGLDDGKTIKLFARDGWDIAGTSMVRSRSLIERMTG